jgi:murein hydrolase activator
VPRRWDGTYDEYESSRSNVTERRHGAPSRMIVDHAFPRRLTVTLLCYAFVVTPLVSQRPQPFDQQLRDNQQRLEGIRRERSDVEQELERLRTQVHSLSDELANIERQKETTNRIVNELDRQINGLSNQLDKTTVDLLLAQDALAEKRAVLERRLVDIYKRGPLYTYQVLLAAESFGDLLSRYKYLYLVSRQDRLLANDMSKLQRRIGRERQTLVDARDALGRRKNERTQELDRYLTLERQRQTSLRETRRSAREAQQRLSELERDEKGLNDRIAALERARREAEARGAATAAAAITTADLGQLDWPVQGRIVYQFGTATGPNNTRIPWHGIGIAAPVGTPVHAIAGGIVSLAGPLGTYLTSVLIDHGGGYYSFYGYLNDATVTKGERVVKGQLVGHVGGGSSDQGPHLHFEIRGQGGIALDPINWLKTRR